MDERVYDAMAEQSVVGSILLDPRCLPEVERSLRPEDLRLEADRALYRAALALEREGGKLDPVTILAQAQRMGAKVSSQYLMQLMEITPTAANVGEYVKIVKKHRLREALGEHADRVRAGVDDLEDPDVILASSQQRLNDLAAQGSAGKLVSPSDGILAYYRQRETIEAGDAIPTPTTTSACCSRPSGSTSPTWRAPGCSIPGRAGRRSTWRLRSGGSRPRAWRPPTSRSSSSRSTRPEAGSLSSAVAGWWTPWRTSR